MLSDHLNGSFHCKVGVTGVCMIFICIIERLLITSLIIIHWCYLLASGLFPVMGFGVDSVELLGSATSSVIYWCRMYYILVILYGCT